MPEFEAVPVDHSAEGPPVVKDLSITPKTEPYNLDRVRAQLAFRLIWILVGVIAAGIVLMATAQWTDVDRIANIGSVALTVFTSIVTLVSAATGFYFGQGGGKGS